ncbi:MAG: hypothetical protein LBH24_00575 [Clostridiales bacterium]|nr:hypothetical protein [Clostridiales bacterium]
MSVRVYGKINLALNVEGSDGRGYHRLDTVMASVSCFDDVTVTKRTDGAVVCAFDGRLAPRSNAAAAGRLIAALAGGATGMTIEIKAGIPAGCGLGGSSADAAGVLTAGAALYGLAPGQAELPKLARRIGSDVPYMLQGGWARLTGTGETLRFFEGPRPTEPVLLAYKGKVSTAACFAAFDARGENGSVSDIGLLVETLRAGIWPPPYPFNNALTAAAADLQPSVGVGLALMAGLDAAWMTGSGAGLIGLSGGDARRAAAEKLKAAGFEVRELFLKNIGLCFI